MIDPRKFLDTIEGGFQSQHGQSAYRQGVMYSPEDVELIMRAAYVLDNERSVDSIVKACDLLLSSHNLLARMDRVSLEWAFRRLYNIQ